MKKLFFVLACIAMSLSAFAQKGFTEKSKFGITVNANYIYNHQYDTQVMPNLQITTHNILFDVSGAYERSDYFRIGMNVGYTFNVLNKLNVYPLIGANLQKWDKDHIFEVSFGAGAQYNIFGNWLLNARIARRDMGIGIGINF